MRRQDEGLQICCQVMRTVDLRAGMFVRLMAHAVVSDARFLGTHTNNLF